MHVYCARLCRNNTVTYKTITNAKHKSSIKPNAPTTDSGIMSDGVQI